MDEISDDVITQAAAGDLKAFEAIYKSTSQFVYNVAYRVLQNREDAQEVTQEVFLLLYHKLNNFRFESSFKTWVYRITTNSAINYAKKHSRHKDQLEYDEKTMPVTTRNEVHENMEKQEQNTKIEQLLSNINPDQRACIVLRNIEGLSYEEIAETLKININTVRTRLKRAREKMMSLRNQVNHE
jgi:RNA polymerase sigma-70 factor (ECF subfamily)